MAELPRPSDRDARERPDQPRGGRESEGGAVGAALRRGWVPQTEGEYPHAIAVVLSEDEMVALQVCAELGGAYINEAHQEAADRASKKLRVAQLEAFARWHG